MGRKVVRDIQKKAPQTVSLVKKNDQHEIHTHASDNTIDCSQKKKRIVKGGSSLADVAGAHDKTKKEKVLYFHIDAEDSFKPDRVRDMVRLFSVGLVILFAINIINVFQNGFTLRNTVIASASVGYEELMAGGDKAARADFRGAQLTFGEAEQSFSQAQQAIATISTQDYLFGSEKTVDSVNALLDAAKLISQAGSNFASGIENLQDLPTLFIQENLTPPEQRSAQKKSLTDKLKEDLAIVEAAGAQLREAERLLNTVDPNILPSDLSQKFSTALAKLSELNQLLNRVEQEIPTLLDLLGDRHPHRYLILLQNDTEARPTGGFIGSYVILDINDGYITKMDFHDIYELDNQLHENIEPPEDIASITDTWRMRDSNYSPDYIISAEKTAWFLQKQGGPSVDSVIAINQSFVEELLRISGPLQLGSLTSPITAENYQTVLSYIVESKLTGESSPKNILAELIPAFKQKLFSSEKLSDALKTFLSGVRAKKILLYSRDEDAQKLFDQLNMSGRVIQTTAGEDYLNVIATSIGGNKSDKYIEQTLKHNTLISADGSVSNELTVTRAHTWSGADFQQWKDMLAPFGYTDFPEHIVNILGRGNNKAFIKIYVPQGSQLTGVSGIEKTAVSARHDDEIGKEYFMFIMEVESGQEKSVTVSYDLPFKLEFLPADTYKFLAQFQPAFTPGYLEKNLFTKPGLEIIKEHPVSFAKTDDNFLEYGGEFDSELYLSALLAN